MTHKMEAILQATDMLKTIANENRLMILCLINEGEMCVGKLVEKVGLSQSALSQHLALMREKGFVKTRKEAQTVYYQIDSPEIKEIIETLHNRFCNESCHTS